MIRLWLAFPIYLITQCLDALTTLIVIGDGGYEINPFIQDLVMDPLLFFTIKMLTVFTFVPVLYWSQKLDDRKRKYVAASLGLVITICLIAVVNNILVIFNVI